MNKRKFSIPFPSLINNESVEKFIRYFMQFQSNIENVYLGIPFLGGNYHNPNGRYIPLASKNEVIQRHTSDCITFLENSEGIFKRIITLNSGVYNYTLSALIEYVDYIIIPFLDKYNIEGVICTDFNMACRLHELRPKLELHTSCNCFIETPREMHMWHEYAGISVFNPPREFIRRPDKLKEMRATGYKLKYLVNESCLFGCPQNKNHVMAWAVDNTEFGGQCHHGITSNFFRGVNIVPRWMKQLDPYVDIYKISGRRVPLRVLKETFEAYYYEKDNVNMGRISFGTKSGIYMGFLANEFPDKLLTCECKDCDNCHLCDFIARTSHKESRRMYFKKDYTEDEYQKLKSNITRELIMQRSSKHMEICFDNEYGEFIEILG